jgi:dTMP kinase
MTERGLFITFEGTDGSGKTTQMRRLAQRLRAAGSKVLETAEPGGTPIGEQIRAILLDNRNHELDRRAEMLLYFASRAQNVHQWILPHLATGGIVLCDRFTDSTLAYQGGGRGLGADTVLALHRIACGALQPSITIYLDIEIEAGLARARARREKLDRMDDQSLDFHRSVRAAYLRLAAAAPDRFRVIDASPDPDTVERNVWETIAPALEAVHVR